MYYGTNKVFKVINIAFLGYETSYQGGINYLKNLFYAIDKLENKQINPVIFVGTKDDYQFHLFNKYIKTIRTTLLDKYSLLWFINRISYKLFKYPIVVDIYMKKYKIQVLSHSIYYNLLFSKSLVWIPDFQPLRYENLWSKDDIIKIK
jgi:hypothetical protein